MKGSSGGTQRTKRLPLMIGHLNHAAAVVRPGCTFLYDLIDASITVQHLDHHLTLTAWAWADIAWWHCFVKQWNSISFFQAPEPSVSVAMNMNASGSWGCGVVWQSTWLHIQWLLSWVSHKHSSYKELAPIIIAVAIWGWAWAGAKVCCYCHNITLVGLARDSNLCACFACSLSSMQPPTQQW